MKNITKFLFKTTLILLIFCALYTRQAYSQPHTNGPAGLSSSGHGSNSAEQAPSAPLGGGAFVLLTIGIAYTINKVSRSKGNKSLKS